ncbi:lysophospholipid acyltransferase family protein [Nonlabens xiamenensis]|uniref:lysophospholipid acyltransferase family protein n=1 Tax=Nonlabens xiamenensis TaxID=2341043 RepID=UPI000F605E6D|nr:lysophospholipid acyltransferase family protein [Nonlabens xiamenensis]
MQAIAFYALYPLLWVLSKLPFFVVYRISDFFYFILWYIVGYRKEVIKNNIRTAFPTYTEQQVQRTAKDSTKHFCDIFIEMIKSMGMSKKSMRKRFTCSNPELVNAFAKAEKPIIAMFGHQGSYEWTMVLDEVLDYHVYAIYKPLKNKYFDALIRKIRKKFGSSMVAMKQATAVMSKKVQTEAALFALVADQSPKASRAQFFTNFFDQPSAVFKGAEKIAREFDCAVVFLKISKVKRGYYSTEFELITADGSATDEWYITDQFFELLETQIRKQPQYYLWSHKRWKTTLDNARRAVELSPSIRQ